MLTAALFTWLFINKNKNEEKLHIKIGMNLKNISSKISNF